MDAVEILKVGGAGGALAVIALFLVQKAIALLEASRKDLTAALDAAKAEREKFQEAARAEREAYQAERLAMQQEHERFVEQFGRQITDALTALQQRIADDGKATTVALAQVCEAIRQCTNRNRAAAGG